MTALCSCNLNLSIITWKQGRCGCIFCSFFRIYFQVKCYCIWIRKRLKRSFISQCKLLYTRFQLYSTDRWFYSKDHARRNIPGNETLCKWTVADLPFTEVICIVFCRLFCWQSLIVNLKICHLSMQVFSDLFQRKKNWRIKCCYCTEKSSRRYFLQIRRCSWQCRTKNQRRFYKTGFGWIRWLKIESIFFY